MPGSANPRLAQAIAGALGERLTRCHHEEFPDSEQRVEILESVRGRDVLRHSAYEPTGRDAGREHEHEAHIHDHAHPTES